jgi:hypothetical protein
VPPWNPSPAPKYEIQQVELLKVALSYDE